MTGERDVKKIIKNIIEKNIFYSHYSVDFNQVNSI